MVHLMDYAAGYYSYMYSRAVASALWADVLDADPLSAAAGARLRDGLLRHGNALAPRQLLLQTLGRDVRPADYVWAIEQV
jgi:intermediate peptidase